MAARTARRHGHAEVLRQPGHEPVGVAHLRAPAGRRRTACARRPSASRSRAGSARPMPTSAPTWSHERRVCRTVEADGRLRLRPGAVEEQRRSGAAAVEEARSVGRRGRAGARARTRSGASAARRSGRASRRSAAPAAGGRRPADARRGDRRGAKIERRLLREAHRLVDRAQRVARARGLCGCALSMRRSAWKKSKPNGASGEPREQRLVRLRDASGQRLRRRRASFRPPPARRAAGATASRRRASANAARSRKAVHRHVAGEVPVQHGAEQHGAAAFERQLVDRHARSRGRGRRRSARASGWRRHATGFTPTEQDAVDLALQPASAAMREQAEHLAQGGGAPLAVGCRAATGS